MGWDNYRVYRQREIIDQTLRKIIFKASEGKPYEFAIDVIGDLIQFYSITFRFINQNPERFKAFILKFNGLGQISKGFNAIKSFVDQFDKSIPLVKFGDEE